MNRMINYQDNLSVQEQEAVELALDTLKANLPQGATLANDDRAADAAESLARYIVASRTP